jgi:subtilisin family serine protease
MSPRKRSPRRARPAASRTGGVRKQSAESGDSPRLVVYVHGIGNKPRESVLRCQWDTALFGVNMGDRSRMAYWVNRKRYPIPDDADCAGADRVEPEAAAVRSLALRPGAEFTAADFGPEIDALTARPEARKALRSIAAQLAKPRPDAGDEAMRVGAREVREKVLPLPEGGRRLISNLLTGMFLKDVHDFLFDAAERDRMCRVLTERLTPGAGPFVVVAHSQGTMIAYQTLVDLSKTRRDLRVPLFVTMGSPLGMQEVVDRIRVFTGVKQGLLPKPPCVERWINIADRADPVAIDNDLAHDYALPDPATNEKHGVAVNPDWMRDPHSATGYLSTDFVRDAVWDTCGPSFAQSVRSFVVARDLHSDIADAPDDRHPVLIELKSPTSGEPAPKSGARAPTIAARRDLLAGHIEKMLRAAKVPAEVGGLETLDRYVAARLNRVEVEELQAKFEDLDIARVWRNSVKRALIYESVKTVQASTAQLGYGALGRDIEWAVLDTGVAAGHPHFAEHENVVREWDCTLRGALTAGAPGSHPAADGDGHGTHVCGIIAGRFPRPLGSRENRSLPPVTFAGMAPEVKLHVYKVLNDQGVGQDSWIIKALDHIGFVNESAGRLVIHGVNLSLGSSFDPEVYGCGHTPLCEELRRLWRQGVLVCVSAGNEGYAVLRSTEGNVEANMDLSIGDPANLDDCIAVGSVHKINPHTYGVSYFSSRGPTADGRRKPDVVAPGERVLSANHRYPARPPARETFEDYFVEMGGTSMACPHVSGILAGFLSVRREFIGYPDRVKQILLANCTDLDRDPYIQGYGLPNLTRMLLNT